MRLVLGDEVVVTLNQVDSEAHRLDEIAHDAVARAVDDDACTLVLMPLVKDPTPGEVPQVWVVSSDGAAQSLGVGNDAPLQSMTVPDALRARLLRDDQTIAVSMEPPGGSPTGQPSGFVIGRGQLTHL